MKFGRVIPAISLLIVICLAANFLVQAQGMPHAIYGVVSVSGGQTIGNATVTLKNSRTDATISTTTDALGHYQADLSSMSGGYQVGDVITVKAESSNGALEGTARVTVSGSALDECNVFVSEKGVVSSHSIYLAVAICAVVAITVILALALSRGKPPVKASGKGRRRK